MKKFLFRVKRAVSRHAAVQAPVQLHHPLQQAAGAARLIEIASLFLFPGLPGPAAQGGHPLPLLREQAYQLHVYGPLHFLQAKDRILTHGHQHPQGHLVIAVHGLSHLLAQVQGLRQKVVLFTLQNGQVQPIPLCHGWRS